jgi:hypothetical protein
MWSNHVYVYVIVAALLNINQQALKQYHLKKILFQILD